MQKITSVTSVTMRAVSIYKYTTLVWIDLGIAAVFRQNVNSKQLLQLQLYRNVLLTYQPLFLSAERLAVSFLFTSYITSFPFIL